MRIEREGAPKVTRHSPCVGVCRLDDGLGLCLGCGRSSDEIASWISMDEGQQNEVWSRLPARLARLSVGVRLLPWVREELVDWFADTVIKNRGSWNAGATELLFTPGIESEIESSFSLEENVIIARSITGLLRFRIGDKLRAFASSFSNHVVLGLPRGRAAIESSSVLRALGPDRDAIDSANRDDLLFDLGAGNGIRRIALRTNDASLAERLLAHAGRPWPEVIASIEPEFSTLDAVRIVETVALRIETPSGKNSTRDNTAAPPSAAFDTALFPLSPSNATAFSLPTFSLPVAVFEPHAATATAFNSSANSSHLVC
jgi:predicted Fe-S protein YdhL (DUF1289 family)